MSSEPTPIKPLKAGKKEHAVHAMLRKQMQILKAYKKKKQEIPVKDLMTRKGLVSIIFKVYEENARKLMEGGHLQQNIAESKLAMLQGNLSPRAYDQTGSRSPGKRDGSTALPTGLTKSLFANNYSKNWHADLFDAETWLLLESVHDQIQ